MSYSAIGLYHPRDMANVGGVLRAAYCYSAAMVAITGTKYKKHSANTPSAERHIPLIHVEDLFSVIPYACVPVAVEIVKGAEDLRDFQHPKSAFYIFGPENGSLGENVLNWCPRKVYVKTQVCMNLAATVNVVLYDRSLKLRKEHDDDQ